MPSFRLYHRHAADDCSATYAAWKGFDSPLRRRLATSSCAWGGHEVWWDLDAADEQEALSRLPRYVATRTVAARVGEVDIP